jgi:small subunit ribosomal protein S18
MQQSTQRRFFRKKYCKFCAEKIEFIDYKNTKMLRGFMTDRGKILSRKITGTCSKHQRQLTRAIKRARSIALLPYIEI